MNQCLDPRALRRVRFALLADDADLGRHTTTVTLPDAGVCSGAVGDAVTRLLASSDSLGRELRALSDGLDRVVALAGEADDCTTWRMGLLTAEVV